ncbi:hypothetical protein WBP07_03860 [Novosphingobium sp. BL-8A]|uniref:hypothetical protein n=1 Tax=Novosphingobium sp. BL-8A TaxID=3127639 RepID=UPI00375737A9
MLVLSCSMSNRGKARTRQGSLTASANEWAWAGWAACIDEMAIGADPFRQSRWKE